MFTHNSCIEMYSNSLCYNPWRPARRRLSNRWFGNPFVHFHLCGIFYPLHIDYSFGLLSPFGISILHSFPIPVSFIFCCLLGCSGALLWLFAESGKLRLWIYHRQFLSENRHIIYAGDTHFILLYSNFYIYTVYPAFHFPFFWKKI